MKIANTANMVGSKTITTTSDGKREREREKEERENREQCSVMDEMEKNTSNDYQQLITSEIDGSDIYIAISP